MGPLDGIRIIEIAGIGPGQFCGMLLADLGAELLRVERLDDAAEGFRVPREFELMKRGRPAIRVDLKHRGGVRLILELCRRADALFEGFRPGVMERLGLGPDACRAGNAALVYGRMTGWGQDGPRAGSAGHDGNYIALAGALHGIGLRDEPPVMPQNLLGDCAGGGAYLAVGLLAALLEAKRSGKGQVVDAAMVDGAASLTTLMHGLQAAGLWEDRRQANLLDGAAPFYRSYATADDKAVVVCAVEPRFYRELLDRLGIDDLDPALQYERSTWQEQAARFAAVFRSRDRDAWAARFADSDACVTPVLSLAEARQDEHLRARGTFVAVDGIVQPAPAPRFSRTPGAIRCGPAVGVGSDALDAWGLDAAALARLRADGVVG